MGPKPVLLYQIAPDALGPSGDAFAQSRGVQSSCTAQIARRAQIARAR